jgi:hypothetical protein
MSPAIERKLVDSGGLTVSWYIASVLCCKSLHFYSVLVIQRPMMLAHSFERKVCKLYLEILEKYLKSS